MKGHRHTSGHEHEFEPQPGLPEALPRGERLLWQGRPDWRALAVGAFHWRALALYFALMLALRGAVALADGAGVAQALVSMAWLLPLPLAGLAIVALLARWSAQGAMYTLTDKRVVMRIGIVLTVTYNLPLKRIAGAHLALAGKGGHGDIALELADGDRIAWLQLWPHARPWKLARPQPALRAVPDAQAVAQRLAAAWSAANGRVVPAAARQDAPEAAPGHGRPLLQP